MEYPNQPKQFGHWRPNHNNRGPHRNPHQTNPNSSRQQNRGNPRQDNRHNPYRRRKDLHYPQPPDKNNGNNPIENDVVIPLSPLEQKIETIVNAVRKQELIGELVLIENNDKPNEILPNAINSVNHLTLNVVQNDEKNTSELHINGKKFAETEILDKQSAKRALCEIVFNDLKERCFHIIKKKCYEEVSTEKIAEPKAQPGPSNPVGGSKAHQMMLKMGWGGKGLGSKEQGSEKSVAEILSVNITREGLGSTNFLGKVQEVLKDYAQSTKMSTLVFDSSLAKEERVQIHEMAARYNLKSINKGKKNNCRVAISRKLEKYDLVKELLRCELENDCYKLIVPNNYKHLWQDS